jgi:hypothetical protein
MPVFRILIVSVILFAVLGNPINAQRVRAAVVPEAVRSSFERKYPYATGIRWAKDQNRFEVSFRETGTGFLVSINNQGRILEIARRVSKKELPGSARSYIDSTFTRSRILEVAVVSRSISRFYKVGIRHKRKDVFLLFDESGKPLPGQRRRASQL